MKHDPATVRVCAAMEIADLGITWEPHLEQPVLPSDEELREQERERKRAWQAQRFEQLREMLR